VVSWRGSASKTNTLMSDYSKIKKQKLAAGLGNSTEAAADPSRENSPFGSKVSGGYFNLKKLNPGSVSDVLNTYSKTVGNKDSSHYKDLKKDDPISSSHRNRFQKLKEKMKSKK
jgi:hypothetical protein